MALTIADCDSRIAYFRNAKVNHKMPEETANKKIDEYLDLRLGLMKEVPVKKRKRKESNAVL